MLYSLLRNGCLAACALLAIAPAQASTIFSDTFNANGYAVIGFVFTGGTIDIASTGGYPDQTISLFDTSFNHIVTNDDTDGTQPHLTLNLAAGDYHLVVSQCCNAVEFAINQGAAFAGTDGTNSGTYWFSPADFTMSDMTAYLDSVGPVSGASWEVTISPDVVANPEPGSIALLSLGGVGLAFVHRRRRAKRELAPATCLRQG